MRLFWLLGNVVRWRVVEILAAGEHTAGEITDALGRERGVERTAIHHHLRRLLQEEVILARRDWSSTIYRLHPRLIGSIRLAAAGLDAMREGARYDDLVLAHDTGVDADDRINRGDLRDRCWCIRKVTDGTRTSTSDAPMYTLEG